MSDNWGAYYAGVMVSDTLAIQDIFARRREAHNANLTSVLYAENERLRQGWDNSVRQHNALVTSYNELARKAAADAARVRELERQVRALEEERTKLQGDVLLLTPFAEAFAREHCL